MDVSEEFSTKFVPLAPDEEVLSDVHISSSPNGDPACPIGRIPRAHIYGYGRKFLCIFSHKIKQSMDRASDHLFNLHV